MTTYPDRHNLFDPDEPPEPHEPPASKPRQTPEPRESAEPREPAGSRESAGPADDTAARADDSDEKTRRDRPAEELLRERVDRLRAQAERFGPRGERPYARELRITAQEGRCTAPEGRTAPTADTSDSSAGTSAGIGDDLLAPTQPMAWPLEEDGAAAPARPGGTGSGEWPQLAGTGARGLPPVPAAGFGRAPGRAVEGAARPGVPSVPEVVPDAVAAALPGTVPSAMPGELAAAASGGGGLPPFPGPFDEPALPEPEGWTAGSADFWSALTSVERMRFLRSSAAEVFPAGHVLWRQDVLADHVAVIWSGKVTIRVNENGVERIVAVRGPGDLIGERAALLVRTRSATVVALDRLTVLRMPIGEFAAFLAAFPRVLAVLDQQMYARLTQPRIGGYDAPAVARPTLPAFRGSGPPRLPRDLAGTHEWAGQVCSIMFVDVVGFSAPHRNDQDRMELRRVLYEAVPAALEGSGVPWAACYHEDRGDGILIVVPPQTPPDQVVTPMLSLLTARLRRHNHAASEAMRLRVRMSLHIGPVMPDREGVNSAAVIQAARLLDAPDLRHRMADTDADVGFVASEYVYDNVLAWGPGLINPRSFQRIRFRAKNAAYTGFMHLSQATS
ncbi:hypothetical protein DZF91_04845 [Actinomadura logoneensis]|uniref:Cyclic nucleotide-binding domain-containing protein n=1 Tax=Actinomadura logoneensis TaxID=2293572 RepID=A0A372JRS6_9ACTN|nr:cyclic nucleotide-binding domain-containing protein [Actinomadura logoneensis]RFU42745.1 hypothetical protein DZF91_04845 [Actinomadura logoneensis]